MPRSNSGNMALLRGLYEHNLQLTGKMARKRPSRPRKSWAGRVLIFATLIAAVSVGITAYRDKPPQPTLAPDEVITRSFGTRADPGGNIAGREEVGLASVYGLGIQTIVLDPGHGGRDPGAIGPSGLTEKTVALDIARRLRRRLTAHGFQVYLTRETDVFLDIRARIDFNISHNADLLISIHVNALEPHPLPVVETYYFSPRGDAATEKLARRENANSGLTLADLRTSAAALTQIVKQEESIRLAENVHTQVFRVVSRHNPDALDWGFKGGPFAVLSNRWHNKDAPEVMSVPAILTELSVINHPDDEKRLMSDEFREQIAGALYTGIMNYIAPPANVLAAYDTAATDAVSPAPRILDPQP